VLSPTELILGALVWQALTGKKKEPVVITPSQPMPRPTGPVQIPADVPKTPQQIPWPSPIQAGIPGAGATVQPVPVPIGPPLPGARPPGPPMPAKPPPPPAVDTKQPQMQKGAPSVTAAAQRGIDAMKKQQEERGTGTGKREFRPKRKGLTQREIARAKELLPGWKKGQTWRSADDPAIIYKAAVHGKGIAQKKAIEVWTSNPDHW